MIEMNRPLESFCVSGRKSTTIFCIHTIGCIYRMSFFDACTEVTSEKRIIRLVVLFDSVLGEIYRTIFETAGKF